MGNKKNSDITSTHPVLCSDGKYRWVFDIPMLTNLDILFEVYRVLTISIGIVWLFVVLLVGCDNGKILSAFWGVTWVFLLILLGLFVLGYVAYFLTAWYYGWKYSVLFTMDEHEVIHQQLPSTKDKARAIGELVAVSGRPGLGIMVTSRTSMVTSFDSVRRLIPCRRRNLIKVNERFSRNRVYVPDEDFDFVYQFLYQHCPAARKG